MTDRIDRCLSKVGNRFMLATVVARRWEQLMTGGRPMVPSRDPRSISVVLREVEEEKLKLDPETNTIERLGEPVEPEIPIEGTAEEDALLAAVGELAGAGEGEEEEEEGEEEEEEEEGEEEEEASGEEE